MTRPNSYASQVRELSKAIAVAYASAGLSYEERNPERGIIHTALPWSCPPLITELNLEGALQQYIDCPINVTAPALRRFEQETLRQMWHTPSQVVVDGTLSKLGRAMPDVRRGQRALRFCTPVGAPSQIDESAALTLALEVAHTAFISLPTRSVLADDNNYVVTLADGEQFGIADGRPLVRSEFTMRAQGMVIELLMAPRGEISYECHYDQIAALRSVLHEHPERFPRTFEALDQGLQTLRCLTLGSHCPDLSQGLVSKPRELPRWRERELAYYEAIETIQSPRLNDREKLRSLKHILVPAAMTGAKFKQSIFPNDKFPFSMMPKRAVAIEAYLALAYKSEIPEALQRALPEKT